MPSPVLFAGYVGKVAPGSSAGSIYCENFLLQQGSVLEIELFGLTGGLDYDQINASGTVKLGNATLNVILGFPSAITLLCGLCTLDFRS